MASKEHRDFSKFMKKQAAKERKEAALKEKEEEKLREAAAEEEKKTVAPAKVTKLIQLRKYDTYQALIEVFPKEGMSVHSCFSLVILYVMKWFNDRLGDDIFEEYPEISFLRTDYPNPEKYADFDIEKVKDIEGLNFVDLETIYVAKKKTWRLSLTELDNGSEHKNFTGRSFVTDISVTQTKTSAVLAIKESCKEPKTNIEDAFGFRPSFVRNIYNNPDLFVAEEGLGLEYAFSNSPIILNGKAGEACTKLCKKFLTSPLRQMPVLFVPDVYYQAYKEGVDKLTESLLGYCHVVVIESTPRKLFSQNLKSDELSEVFEEGQLILYRSNPNQAYEPDYYEPDTEDLLATIKATAQREPIRKVCDFRGFLEDFTEAKLGKLLPDKEKTSKKAEEPLLDRVSSYMHANLQQEIGALKRDNDLLQKRNDELAKDNKNLEKESREWLRTFAEQQKDINALEEENKALKGDNLKKDAELLVANRKLNDLQNNIKEIYKPLTNLPAFGKNKKEEILDWIADYYSEELIISNSAKKSFMDESRNIDWHRFCMMIHYIAGYTKHRNGGGMAIDSGAAREYDPENAAYTVTPVSGGALGAAEFHKDKYTVRFTGADGVEQTEMMDLHVKYGKGSDSNMIRIYFYYSAALNKSILGYMPGHLPTRKDSH